jgi:hypothetical protein
MIEIYARLDLKPPLPSEGEMTNRMKQLEKTFRNREFEHLVSGQAREASLSRGERRTLASAWSLFERRLVIFFKDFDHYIDFCIARYIVWRETRRDGRGGKKE